MRSLTNAVVARDVGREGPGVGPRVAWGFALFGRGGVGRASCLFAEGGADGVTCLDGGLPSVDDRYKKSVHFVD